MTKYVSKSSRKEVLTGPLLGPLVDEYTRKYLKKCLFFYRSCEWSKLAISNNCKSIYAVHKFPLELETTFLRRGYFVGSEYYTVAN